MFLANSTQKLGARILEAHLLQGRVAHSYIFSGKEDPSEMAELATQRKSTDIKEEFAVAFATALLSGQKKLFGSIETPLSQRVWKRAHPDVRWIGEDKDEKSIKIGKDSGDPGTIREIIHWASLKPYESPWKVCIALKAERLTEEAANAFLKTLEEPPAHTVFCLLVENKTHLLDTIQSRSFEIRLAPTPVEIMPANAASLDAMPVREILDFYQGLTRQDLKQKLDGLMLLAREKVRLLVSEKSGNPRAAARWLEAMDLLYDSKAALDANANQKLLVTRLAMRLRRLFPSQKAVL